MTQAIALLDGEPQLELPVSYVPEPERARLTVPLVLLIGWAVLFAFIVSFLMDDDGSPPSAELAAGSEVSGEVVRAAARTAHAAAAEPSETKPTAPGPYDLAPVRAMPEEPSNERVATLPEPMDAPPLRRAEAVGIERPGFVGVWGPDARACGVRARRRGLLPATITENGAKAGSTTCRFRNPRRDGPGWTTAADCSDGGHRWTSQVRLVVNGNTLNWMSEKGPARYVRCGRRNG